MRPLPVEPVTAMPEFVSGVSIIRGAPVPVVDLGVVLGFAEDPRPTRFVKIAVEGRFVAVAVEQIVGVHAVPSPLGHELPPLLGGASEGVVASLDTLDAGLLVFLETSRLLPEEIWQAMVGSGARA
jgi:purine-binding chemotaxis protein CheW